MQQLSPVSGKSGSTTDAVIHATRGRKIQKGDKKKMGRPPRVPPVRGPVPHLAPAPSPASARSATAPPSHADEDVADEFDELLQPPIPPEPALPVPVPRPPTLSSSHWAMTGGEVSFQDTNSLHRGVNGSSDGFPAGRLSLDSGISFGAPRQYQSPHAGRESRATKMKLFTDETLTTSVEVDAMLSSTIVSRSCVANWFVRAFGPGPRFIDGPYGREQVATINVQLDRGLIFPLESLPVVTKNPLNVALWISLEDIGRMTIQEHHFPPDHTARPPVPATSQATPHSSHPEYGLSSIEKDDDPLPRLQVLPVHLQGQALNHQYNQTIIRFPPRESSTGELAPGQGQYCPALPSFHGANQEDAERIDGENRNG